jgi:hypothetical protein
MARFLKITKYKLQNTNKFQITTSEITNSPIGLKNPVSYSSPKAFKYVRRTPDVCNLYFVICNFPDKPVPFWFRLVRAVTGKKRQGFREFSDLCLMRTKGGKLCINPGEFYYIIYYLFSFWPGRVFWPGHWPVSR